MSPFKAFFHRPSRGPLLENITQFQMRLWGVSPSSSAEKKQVWNGHSRDELRLAPTPTYTPQHEPSPELRNKSWQGSYISICLNFTPPAKKKKKGFCICNPHTVGWTILRYLICSFPELRLNLINLKLPATAAGSTSVSLVHRYLPKVSSLRSQAGSFSQQRLKHCAKQLRCLISARINIKILYSHQNFY